MAKLRFPNPGSDLDRMVNTYRHFYRAFEEEQTYTIDDAVRVLIDRGQVSSRGAVGEEAIRRSTEKDRSKDPLYNQVKMYSELYRMLGWIHPVEKKLAFRNTMLGSSMAADDVRSPRVQGLLQECLIGISFPNPNSENIGIKRLRFFPLLLRFMEELDGFACRDEIIIGLYGIVNDSASSALEQGVARIKEIRGDQSRLSTALNDFAAQVGVQVNTFQNYTRFPLGVIKSPLVKWARDERVRGPYRKSMKFYVLDDGGQQQLRRFYDEGLDLRTDHLAGLPREDRAFLALVGHTVMHQRAGYVEAANDLASLRAARSSFAGADRLIGEHSLEQVYFSPFQQADHADLAYAMTLSEMVLG